MRILIVDDSAFARKVVRETVERAGYEVVGFARDGLEALEAIERLEPDLITLDLAMPHLDGLGVLDALVELPTPPRALVVTVDDQDAESSLAALERGALAVVSKPASLPTAELASLATELERALELASVAAPVRPLQNVIPPPSPVASVEAPTGIVVVGTSTGGPRALTAVCSSLPADFPLPVAMVVHIPEGYTGPLARRLDQQSALEVCEAAPGLEVRAGRIVIARAGSHLRFRETRTGVAVKLSDRQHVDELHCPSADVMFQSAAEVFGPSTLGVVLTGMGSDGVEGARAIVAAGGAVITEDPSTCTVYGMPRAVVEAGLSAASAPLGRIVELLVERLPQTIATR